MKTTKIKNGCFEYNNFKIYFSVDEKKIEKNEKQDAIIYLNGLPKPGNISEFTNKFVSEDFIVFNIYYPGYWEADGELNFKNLPDQTIEVSKFIKKGQIYDLFSQSNIKFNIDKILLLGSSFGGTIALNMNNDIFSKIISISPLVNFTKHKSVIDDLFLKFNFFKNVIRIKNTSDLIQEDFYSLDPFDNKSISYSKKLFIFSDTLDKSIKHSIIEDYANNNNIILKSYSTQKHGYKLLLQEKVITDVLQILNR